MTKDKAYFAPLPNRALADDRLGRLHLRVLGVIAAHDRFSVNGKGCTLSTRRMGEIIGCKQTNVAAACRWLAGAGYVRSDPNPAHKQMRMMSVIYDPTLDKWAFAATPNRDAERARLATDTEMQRGPGSAANRDAERATEENTKRYSVQNGEDIPPQAGLEMESGNAPETRFEPSKGAEDFTLRDPATMAVWGPLRGKSSA